MIITLDFETFYDVRYSLTAMPNFEYVTDPRFKAHGLAIKIGDCPTQWVSHAQLPAVLNNIDWEEATVVCHNTYFDISILAWQYGIDIESIKTIHDTKGMALALTKPIAGKATLNETARFLLEDAKIEGALLATKGIMDLPRELEDQLAVYAIQDVDLTRKIYDELLPDMKEEELALMDLHTKLYFRKHVLIDKAEVENVRKYDNAERDELFNQARKNWPSLFGECQTPDELFTLIRKDNKSIILDAVKQEGKVCPKKRNKTGKVVPAVSKADLEFQELCSSTPRLTALREIVMRAGSSIIQTRCTTVERMHDRLGGYHHPYINYYGAHTGRSSGSDGLNCQNLNKILRPIFTAPKGKKIVIADSSNIEARVLAWLAGEQSVLDICAEADRIDRAGGSAKAEGKDIYTQMSKKIGSSDRQLGKMVVLGCGYAMSLRTFIFNARINGAEYTDEELQKAFYGWRTSNTAIVKFWDELFNDFKRTALNRVEVTRERYAFEKYRGGTAMVLPSGRPVIYPKVRVEAGRVRGEHGQNYWPGLIAENLTQALARDIVFYQTLKSDWVQDRLWILIHDELDMVEDEDKAADLLAHTVECLSTGFDWCEGLPLNGAGGIVDKFTKL